MLFDCCVSRSCTACILLSRQLGQAASTKPVGTSTLTLKQLLLHGTEMHTHHKTYTFLQKEKAMGLGVESKYKSLEIVQSLELTVLLLLSDGIAYILASIFTILLMFV
jgi:hypothetical protein